MSEHVAKFQVGNEIVTGYVDGDARDHLIMTDGVDEWQVSQEQLEESYTPVSEHGQHLYEIITRIN